MKEKLIDENKETMRICAIVRALGDATCGATCGACNARLQIAGCGKWSSA